MPSLAEIIARHEARNPGAPTPLNEDSLILTSKGHAYVASVRAVRAIRDLKPAEREDALRFLHDEIAKRLDGKKASRRNTATA